MHPNQSMKPEGLSVGIRWSRGRGCTPPAGVLLMPFEGCVRWVLMAWRLFSSDNMLPCFLMSAAHWRPVFLKLWSGFFVWWPLYMVPVAPRIAWRPGFCGVWVSKATAASYDEICYQLGHDCRHEPPVRGAQLPTPHCTLHIFSVRGAWLIR